MSQIAVGVKNFGTGPAKAFTVEAKTYTQVLHSTRVAELAAGELGRSAAAGRWACDSDRRPRQG
jgi:hypothetical protein